MPAPGHGGASPPGRLVLGSRRSELARVQAERVRDLLLRSRPAMEVEIRWVVTAGDRVLDRPLPEIGGKGLFTAELEAALLSGKVDVAVHSLKDLPTDPGEGFEVACVPLRADPRDVLLGPEGPLLPGALEEAAVVGTSSPRRAAQLLRHRPDCRVRDIRGNVGTRVGKMRRGDYDAVLLAAAGLHRLGLLGEEEGPALDPPAWLPAPGQGAICLEGRAGDRAVRAALATIEDPEVRAAVTAERALLAGLEGGCSVPVAALATVRQGTLALEALVLAPDGSRELRTTAKGPAEEAEALGRRAAERLLRDGAASLLDGGREA